VKTEPYRSRSLAPGLVISLLIHAGLLVLFMHQRPVPPPAQPARWLTVSLLPAPAPKIEPAPEPVQPAPAPAPVPDRPAVARPKTPAIAKAPAVRPQAQRPDQEQQREPAAITMIPAAPNDPPDPFAAAPSKPAGTFDTAAALQSARKLAVAKAGKDDPAVAQLRDKPINDLASENELGKGIKRGARPGCLMSGAGAGILAPLVIAAQVLTDKKDHGCKW
jgi:hypothetical protein